MISHSQIRPHHDSLPPIPIQVGRSRLLHERLPRRAVVSLLREEGERSSDPYRVDGSVIEEEAEVGHSGSWNHRGSSPNRAGGAGEEERTSPLRQQGCRVSVELSTRTLSRLCNLGEGAEARTSKKGGEGRDRRPAAEGCAVNILAHF